MIKFISKLGIKENFFGLIKGIHKTPTANVLFYGEK